MPYPLFIVSIYSVLFYYKLQIVLYFMYQFSVGKDRFHLCTSKDKHNWCTFSDRGSQLFVSQLVLDIRVIRDSSFFFREMGCVQCWVMEFFFHHLNISPNANKWHKKVIQVGSKIFKNFLLNAFFKLNTKMRLLLSSCYRILWNGFNSDMFYLHRWCFVLKILFWKK